MSEPSLEVESINFNQNGFTLVELLVVIAIIAILFAVVLVAINPAQRFKDSRNSRRLSDVKSIVEAATTYTADRRGAQLPDVPDYQCVGTKPADSFSTIPTGSTAVWKFDTSLSDETATKNTLNQPSPSYTTGSFGKFGEAIQMNGSGSYLYTADHADLDPAASLFSLEGWIKLSQKIEPGTFDHHLPIFDKGSYRLQLNSDSGRMEWETQENVIPSWNTDYTLSTEFGVNTIMEFQGSLYGGTNNATTGSVIKKNGSSWENVSGFPPGAKSINALNVYNNKLYSGQTSTDNIARVYSFDGNSWNDTGLNISDASVLSLARYKSKLYAGIGIELPNTGGASIWEYDGTSWRSSKDFAAADAVAVYSFTVFNGKLYAGTGREVGVNDAQLFEHDGSLWTQRATFPKNGIYSLAEYQKELYVGLGGGEDSDGEIWKWTQSGGPSIVEPGAAYKRATHSLSAYSGTLYAGWSDATPPGEIRKLEAAWTPRATPSSNAWRSVAYGNGLFVAVADFGTDRVMTSPDGINWTSQNNIPTNAWRSVAYGSSLFVAVADSGVMTSSNGSTWDLQTGIPNNAWRSVTYGNGLFVAVACGVNDTACNDTAGNRVMTSSNGTTWTPRASAADNIWTSIAFGNNTFVAVACGVNDTACNDTAGNRVMTSSDNGSTWTSAVSATENMWNSVTYGNGLFVAVSKSGDATDRVMTSPNGSNWTSRVSPNTSTNNNSWNSVTYGNGLFVAVSTTTVNNWTMISPDGINWSLKASAANKQWASVTYGNGLFVAVASNGSSEKVMTYKATWMPSDSTSTEEVRAIYPYMGKLYAATRGDDTADATIRSYGGNGYVGSQKTVWYPNTWYHLAGIYDGTNSVMNLMINGHLSATTSSGVPGTLLNNSNSLYIGSGYNSDPFDGVLDNFAIYNNTALSADTIASHAGCYNLGQYLVPEYMGALPIDPSSTVTDGTDTGYFISKDAGGVITVTAPLTEITSSIPEIIKASR